MNVRVTSLLFAAVAASVLPACSPLFRSERPASQNVQFTAGTPLEVLTHNGDVTVRVDPQSADMVVDAVIVGAGNSESEARMRAELIRVDVAVTDGKTVVQAVYPNGERRSSEGCSFVIRVPAVSDLLVHSSNGAIDLTGNDASQGMARLDTSNGAVRVQGHRGPLHVDSSNGALVLEDVAGEIEAETSNGTITVRNAGDLSHALSLASSNGDITLEVAGGISGNLHAATSNGSVTIDGFDTVISQRSLSKSVCDYTFDHSGPHHSIATSNGTVRVRRGPTAR